MLTSDLLEQSRAISFDTYHERQMSFASPSSSNSSRRSSFRGSNEALHLMSSPLLLDHDDLLSAFAGASFSGQRSSSPSPSSDLSHPLSLTSFQKLSFSGGHILNDMAASLWFTYLLVYLESTLYLSPSSSGIVMLSGQIADGLATPLMGLLSDSLHGRYYTVPLLDIKCCCRTFIHFISTIFVAVCFSGVWIVTPATTSVAYYAAAASLFNVGENGGDGGQESALPCRG